MSAELTIRRYRPTDAAAVWEVHKRSVSDAVGVFDPDGSQDLHEIERTYLEDGDFFVGCLDDIVAIGGLRRLSDTVGEIRRVRVIPEYQNRGYSRAVVEALEESARELGIETLHGTAVSDFETSIELHHAYGYEEVDRQHSPTLGCWYVVFEKSLTATGEDGKHASGRC